MKKLIAALVCIMCNVQSYSGYNFTTFDDPTGIFLVKTFDTYISYNNWKLYYYYDLSEFFENINLYKDCLEKMEKICSSMPEREQCETMIKKHNRLILNINLDLEYIYAMEPKTKKQRRDALFGFIGSYVGKPLFGLMDEEDASIITEKINSLINAHQTQTIALKNGLSIVQQTIKITNETMFQLNRDVHELNRYVNNITTTISDVEIEIKQHIDFNYISSLATMISVEHQHAIHIIKSALKNTLHGEFSSLITHKQFLKDLQEISETLDETSFTIIDDIKQIQQVVSIKGTIMQKRLLVEFTIPILERNPYQLNSIVSIPVEYKNNTILINMENSNYLVNNLSRIYIPIEKDELKQCKKIYNQTLVCYPQTEAYFENSDICISNVLFEKTAEKQLGKCTYDNVKKMNLIKALGDNSYYIYVTEPMLMRENCLRIPTKLFSLNNTGILKIDPNCEIIFNNMRISTRNSHIKEKIVDIDAPQTFHRVSIRNLKALKPKLNQTKLETKFLTYNDNFKNLINKTEKEKERLDQSTVITTIETSLLKKNLIILIAFIILIIIIKALLKKLC